MSPSRLPPIVFLAALVGCSPKPPATPAATPAAAPAVSRPFVEVTPVARALLGKVAADQKFGADWWVRLNVVWKPDAQIVVTVEKDPPGPADEVHEANGVRVVMPGDQAVYLKGARIDLVEDEGGWAFDVTFPHRDARDREAANKWLRERSPKKG
jgi:Fe-S cluster assembly iron-binding protein IscA